jgi:tetratricopeptide (TPR) repeat protein
VTIDRQEVLRRAGALLKQGQIDAAIQEYAALAAANPSDWSSLNILGDLHVRAGRPREALAFYGKVADHYLVEGFHARAAGFYKKILKFAPHDEDVRIKLARACAQQGLIVEARGHLQDVLAARRRRGDSVGAAAAMALVAELDERERRARSAPAADEPHAVDDEPRPDGPAIHALESDTAEHASPGPSIDASPSPGVAMEVDLTELVDALALAGPPAPEPAPVSVPQPTGQVPVSLEGTFAALRQSSSPGAADLVTLGRTYVGAGMLDEAAEALEAAAHDPAQRYDASVAMVEICVTRRDQAGVIEWLERATEAAPTPAKRGAALYRLGLALEQAGEPARALAIWLELQALAPAFRDVGARIARLQSPRSGGAPSGS